MNGVSELELSVTDIHKELKLCNRYAAVCNAIERKFEKRFGLNIISAEGPENSARTYRISLRG
jgi:hypothetical protein